MPTISIAKGKGSMAHNNREFIADNVNAARTKDNITYARESLLNAYEQCFGSAIQAYNEKQKRSDRKINGVKGYMEKIKGSKNGEKLFYEIVVQIGNMHDCNVDSEQGQVCKSILDEYMKSFQERNPNLYVFNAVLHMDEETPHLHIDYIPIANGYSKGLQCRNSLDKALRTQGIDGEANKYGNRTIVWQRAEKTHLEGVLREHGLERTKESGLNRSHFTVEQYKAIMSEVKNEIEQMPKQIESKPIMLNKDKVTVNKKDLEVLEHRAKLSTLHEKASQEVLADTKEKTNNYIQQIENRLNAAAINQKMTEFSLENAKKEKEKYEKLYRDQLEMNEKYKVLEKKCLNQEKEISNLKTENHSLKEELQSQIAKAIAPFKEKVEELNQSLTSLSEKFEDICECFANLVKAYNLFKYDQEIDGYGLQLNKKQSRLFDAIESYAKKWLKSFGKNKLVKDLEENVGLSAGIRKEVKEISRNQSRGWER